MRLQQVLMLPTVVILVVIPAQSLAFQPYRQVVQTGIPLPSQPIPARWRSLSAVETDMSRLSARSGYIVLPQQVNELRDPKVLPDPFNQPQKDTARPGHGRWDSLEYGKTKAQITGQ